ncbi:hypothetical protein MKX07_005315 [Trichoderma sp. CBMAI-0711]|nr:hypothetical protein MKX07_005315 [Trichoderma sp. CBMAI-0711]
MPLISRCLVVAFETDHAPWADQFFACWRMVTIFIGILAQFGLEGSDFVLQRDDIAAIDLAALGGVEVFANGSRSLAGKAAGQRRVASRLSLPGDTVSLPSNTIAGTHGLQTRSTDQSKVSFARGGGVAILTYLATTTACSQRVGNTVARGIAVEVVVGTLDQVPRRSVDVVRTGSNGAQTLPENVSGIHGAR